MKDPRDLTMGSEEWIRGRDCRCVLVDVWWRWNGAEALTDWIVRDAVESVLRAG